MRGRVGAPVDVSVADEDDPFDVLILQTLETLPSSEAVHEPIRRMPGHSRPTSDPIN